MKSIVSTRTTRRRFRPSSPITRQLGRWRHRRLFLGHLADPLAWIESFAVGVVVMWFSYFWFERTRHAFADVV